MRKFVHTFRDCLHLTMIHGYAGNKIIACAAVLGVIFITLKTFVQMDDNNDKGKVSISPEDMEKDANMMRQLRVWDRQLVAKFLNTTPERLNDGRARAEFYETISRPLQGVCRSLKRLGGQWYNSAGVKAVDGDKFLCMDNYNKADCLVYSFGVRYSQQTI